MSHLASEIWSELKRYINTVDRDEAAETMVSVLIEHNIDADEIRDAFKGHSEIKRALTSYLDDADADADADEYDEYNDDDED